MRLRELLEYSEVVIQCHDFPDADAIASGFAVYMYLKQHGKKVRLVYSGKKMISKPNLLLLVERLDIPIEYVQTLKKPEALLLVDCFYGEGNVTKLAARNIYIIDHHLCNDTFAYHTEIRNNYGSCSSIVAKMLLDEGIDYNDDIRIATALYYGLYTDTNGMDELRHPADRDIRDFAKYDGITINILKNSNLSLQEMKIAGDALKHYKYNEEYRFAVVEAKPCDPNLLGFISDLLLQVDQVDTCVVFCNMPFGAKLSVRSCINDVRANEVVSYIVKEYGSGGGHAQKAGGYIGKSVASKELINYINDKIIAYYQSFEIIHAKDYEIDLSDMKKYVKLPVTVGYVRGCDILPEGTDVCIRSLEADINVCMDEDLYIMIGIHGEVYPINRMKFEQRYDKTDAPFDIQLDYSPNIIDRKTGTVKDLIPFLQSCVSQGKTKIYAKELTKTMKVYTAWDSVNYMLGNVGDYIAVRENDLHDIYIIEGDIFHETYQMEE